MIFFAHDGYPPPWQSTAETNLIFRTSYLMTKNGSEMQQIALKALIPISRQWKRRLNPAKFKVSTNYENRLKRFNFITEPHPRLKITIPKDASKPDGDAEQFRSEHHRSQLMNWTGISDLKLHQWSNQNEGSHWLMKCCLTCFYGGR